MNIEHFFDPSTQTISHLISDPDTLQCAVIDPVLDFDLFTGTIRTDGVQAIIQHIFDKKLTLTWILETHAHADHLSAAAYLQQRLGGKIAIGEHITAVQRHFAKLFHLGDDFATDGSQFDHLFVDGEHFHIGNLSARVLHTPGHTPACITYIIGDAAFVGDTLFMPDLGTARADFPGGAARDLYTSIRRILDLADATRLFMCHDYPPPTRDPQWESSVALQRRHNVFIHQQVSPEEFEKQREKRDAYLTMPSLILPALQINIRAGRLPAQADNGIRYLQLPLNQLQPNRESKVPVTSAWND